MTGWFASSSASEEKPSPISRESRQACWNTRDAFFQCLNTNGVDIPPSTFTPKNVGKGGACEAALKDYEANCARSWVSLTPGVSQASVYTYKLLCGNLSPLPLLR